MANPGFVEIATKLFRTEPRLLSNQVASPWSNPWLRAGFLLGPKEFGD